MECTGRRVYQHTPRSQTWGILLKRITPWRRNRAPSASRTLRPRCPRPCAGVCPNPAPPDFPNRVTNPASRILLFQRTQPQAPAHTALRSGTHCPRSRTAGEVGVAEGSASLSAPILPALPPRPPTKFRAAVAAGLSQVGLPDRVSGNTTTVATVRSW